MGSKGKDSRVKLKHITSFLQLSPHSERKEKKPKATMTI
jgi:hypothetical protein